MRFGCALLGIALLAVPAVAQPFIIPLQRQPQSEAPPPTPSPTPVAPPQAGMAQSGRQTDGTSRAEARDNAQPGDRTSSTQAFGAQSGDASHAAEQ